MPRVAAVLALVFSTSIQAAEPEWPALPEKDASVLIPAQEWPLRPGPRTVRVSIHYPGGTRAGITAKTGLMLTLHNWGGTDCVGTADPSILAEKLNVVALCVNYLQSGKADSIDRPEAYDFGYLQALDALRALGFVEQGLTKLRTPFAVGRTFCTGGSGGGNVALMANKLAPRTFACVVDLCGMKKLTDDIAFHLPGGSDLNARYSRDPKHPNYLTRDHQELRYIGNPDHLAEMKRLGCDAKLISVHGRDDTTCPFADAEEMAFWMVRAKLDFEPHWIAKSDLDGRIFTSSGHALGDRTQIVLKIAGKYLEPDGTASKVRRGASDFSRREAIRYRTSGGAFVISYAAGYPVGHFEPATLPVDYPNHTDLSFVLDAKGKKQPIRTRAEWKRRREHIAANVARVMGPLPSPLDRVPLTEKEVARKEVGDLIRRQITYQSDPGDPVSAYLFTPARKSTAKLPAILALHQTTRLGKDEPAGLGHKDMAYGLELARRGYIVLIPDYPGFGEHDWNLAKSEYASGSMKAVWDNIRAIDLLESLPEVDAERIGVIGHSLGGHNAIFTAFHDPRLQAIVSNCGFTTFRKDDLPSWTGSTYMPRIRAEFKNDAKLVPFDFQELVAGIAPRAFLVIAAEKDDDFDAGGVRDVLKEARAIYALFGASENLCAVYPAVGHSFPADARARAYEFLDRHLKRKK